jgi:hypothetical protein
MLYKKVNRVKLEILQKKKLKSQISILFIIYYALTSFSVLFRAKFVSKKNYNT